MRWLLALAALAVPPDRSVVPAVHPPSALPPPTTEIVQVRAGLRLIHVRVPEVQSVTVAVIARRGRLDLEAPWALVNILQEVAPLGLDTEGATLEPTLSPTSGGWILKCSRDALPRALGELSEILANPRYDREAIRAQQRAAWNAVHYADRLRAVRQMALTLAWFAPDLPFGQAPVPSLRRISRPRMTRTAMSLFEDAPTDVLIVGNLSAERARGYLQPLLQSLGGTVRGKLPPRAEAPATERSLMIQTSEEQAFLSVRTPAPPVDHPARDGLRVITHALGGSFYSRLNRDLREQRGLTYYSSATMVSAERRGHVTISMQLSPDSVAEAVAAVREILDDLSVHGLTEEELREAWLHELSSWNTQQRTSAATAEVALDLLNRGLWFDDRRADLDRIRTLTAADTRRLAQDWLSPRLWVVTGPSAILEAQFEQLGWQIHWNEPTDVMAGRGRTTSLP